MKPTGPIGVFDSGVGGLSVLKEIRRELPNENLLYVADSAFAPYGNKSTELIQKRSLAIAAFLLEHDVKAIVVACNTATAAAISELRDIFNLPILGMEPAVKPAIAATKTNTIGILATEGTLSSVRFAALLGRFNTSTQVFTQPGHGLVELVEAGQHNSLKAQSLLRQYLDPMLGQGIDTLILGCTHYAFLLDAIRQVTGPDISIITTGSAVAKHLKSRLADNKLLRQENDPGTEYFWSSGNIETGQIIFDTLWGKHLPLKPLSG